MTELIDLRHGDCQKLIKTLPDESVNIILTDPPYLYLKGQKLEREFDEKALFAQWKRVLKKGGFVLMFGRGTSFYRWNYLLSEIGFEFKEEIVWNKRMNTLPGLPLQRFHETISIYSNGKASINKCKVPYLAKKQFDAEAISQDIKRISSAIGGSELEDLRKYVETGEIVYTEKKYNNFFKNGHGDRSRATAILKSIKEGMSEGSIMEVLRGHYDSIHPTQKPVDLLKRLLALVIKSPDDVVLDCFAGSGSTGEACIEMKLKFIGFEIDDEYYGLAKDRLEKAFRNRDTQIPLF